MSPALSVLMPVFNAAPWLREAALSVLGDGFEDLELLLLDDGSSDTSVAIASELAAKDRRVRLVVGPHRGIVGTLNHGLALARAPYVARMDADDVSLPGRFAAQLDFLAAYPEVAIVDGRVEIFRDDGPTLAGFATFESWLNGLEGHSSMRRSLLIDSPLVHPAICARTQVLRRVGGYREGVPEDYDLWLRVVAAGHRLHKLPRLVLRWRDHSARLTRTDARYKREVFTQVKLQALEPLGVLWPGARVVLWGAGKGGRPWARGLVEGGWLTAVLDIDPRKQGTTRQGVRTWPVEALEQLQWDRLLVAVGARGARQVIGARLVELGVAEAPEGKAPGFWFVA